MHKFILGILALGLAVTATSTALAQDATERAGALKAWREQCSDPDVDLRTAYIEAAIATEDVAVMRICVRQSLDSDDADIRNLGLRAALASIEQINFDVKMPDQLAAAYKKAGNDADQLRKMDGWDVVRSWAQLQTGFVVVIDEADVAGGTSVWSPLVGLEKKSTNYVGQASIIGSRLTWVGEANLPRNDCHLDAQLAAGGMLEGTLQCADLWPFPVSAQLL